MGRIRDFQRSKVYKAENVLEGMCENRFTTIAECDAWIKENVIPHLKDYGIKKIVLKDGRGRKSACAYWDGKTIALPKFARKDWMIIHEVAHLPFGNRVAGHGEEFCALYIKLVGLVLGESHQRTLKRAFDINGVRY